MKLQSVSLGISTGIFLMGIIACSKSKDNPYGNPKNPDTAPVASVDRFSQTAGHLQVRTSSNGLPAPNAPVNFDQAPFVTMGFSPNGSKVAYYNFDIQPTNPAPIYVLFKEGQ